MFMKWNLHHVGLVVSDISKSYSWYKKLGYRVLSGFEKPQLDSAQKVWVGVIKQPGQIYIELLSPYGSNSPVAMVAKRGGGLHHICYEVIDIMQAVIFVNKHKLGKQLTPVTISVWSGRPVVFFYDATGSKIFEIIGQPKV